jgi:hypothetical protein
MRLALIFWALLFFGICGRAHAQTAFASLQVLCPKATALAPHVEAAAATWRVRPVVLVAMIRTESTCGTDLVNERSGALGHIQVMPGRSADPNRLPRARLLDPATNLDLGARHLRRCVDLCGSLAGGLSVFHGKKKCKEWRGDKYVKRVLGFVAGAKRSIRAMTLKLSA